MTNYRLKSWIDSLNAMSVADRCFTCFWLLGPFFLLIERSVGDLYLSIIGLSFFGRSVLLRDWNWISHAWVKACFVFLICLILSGIQSRIPTYSTVEALIWFRFPLFAFATVFWLARKKEVVGLMLLSLGLATITMVCIIFSEVLIEGQKNGRLYWPFGDAVTGNYLVKVSLPLVVALIALAFKLKRFQMALVILFLWIVSLATIFTGERINALILFSSFAFAFVASIKSYKKIFLSILLLGMVLLTTILAVPSSKDRFITRLIQDNPFISGTVLNRTWRAGLAIAENDKIIGTGPATFRQLCPKKYIDTELYRCDNHPHNFYIQLYSETGFVGLIAGVLMIFMILREAAKGFFRNPKGSIPSTAFIVPLAFFFPVASTADFFGQWNNLFIWTSIAIALAQSKISE